MLLGDEQKWAEAEELLLQLAQELREYAAAAEESGESILSTEELLAEVDRYFAPPAPTDNRTCRHAMNPAFPERPS